MQVAGATGDVSKLDYFNWDVIIPSIAEIQGVPASWLNSEEVIKNIREQRAQAAQEQQMVAAAPAAAAMIKAGAAAKKSGGI